MIKKIDDDLKKHTKTKNELTSTEVNVKSENKNTKNKKVKAKKEPHPITQKVIDLQIYNMPLFKISSMLDTTEIEIEKIMIEDGFVRIGDRFVVKPKPIRNKTKTAEKKKSKKSKVKEKTKKQLLEEEYKRNPAKRGVFDPINQVWVINVQLVEIIELQLKHKDLGLTAKQMKMSKPAVIEFAESKGFILEDNQFIQTKYAKKNIPDLVQETENTKEVIVKKPRIYNDRKENVEFTEETFSSIQEDIQNMFNWYTNIKEHALFEKLKKDDMEK